MSDNTCILVSGKEILNVTGSDETVANSARLMSQRTKRCVTIAVIKGHYHVKGCSDLPAGGIAQEPTTNS